MGPGTAALVLVLCSDGALGGSGTCAALAEAMRGELEELGLEVVEGAAIEAAGQAKDGVPAVVAEATTGAGAACAVWAAAKAPAPALAPQEEAGPGVVLGLYSPGSLTPVKVLVPVKGADGKLDLGDAAFRLRILIASDLFPDLPGLDVPSGPEPAPAPAPAPAQPVAEEAPDEAWPQASDVEVEAKVKKTRPLVGLAAGYLLASYPLEGHLYSGVALALSIRPWRGLEIALDAGITAANKIHPDSTSGGPGVVLENAQHVVGIGAGYSIAAGRVLSFTPKMGLHLGISDTLLVAPGHGRYRELNVALWAGLDVELRIVRWLFLRVGATVENLFKYEAFDLIEGADKNEVFSLSQLRVGFVAVLQARF